jgi:hypothetical protein
MLFSASAGKANHRSGTETAATNIHGHLLRAHDPQPVIKKLIVAIFSGSIMLKGGFRSDSSSG